jgi:hypothetical protein
LQDNFNSRNYSKTAILPVNVENETIAAKKIVYQVFRLFGNKNTNNKPWGTIEEKMEVQ